MSFLQHVMILIHSLVPTGRKLGIDLLAVGQFGEVHKGFNELSHYLGKQSRKKKET